MQTCYFSRGSADSKKNITVRQRKLRLPFGCECLLLLKQFFFFCVFDFTDAGVLMADTTYGNLAVGEGVRMQGNLSVPGEAIVDGQIEGVLTAQSVFVTDNGAIQGTTTADHVRVAGRVSETTVANKTLLIESTGVATGQIAYADLEIRKGGDIQGNIRIIQRPA
jgi:cytoskeletal protein CcmA (bactofilin family)